MQDGLKPALRPLAEGLPDGNPPVAQIMLLPVVMRWNNPASAELQALAAAAMGHQGGDAGNVLAGFIAGLGMPRSLGAVKIEPESFARLAEQAMDTPRVPRNPRRVVGPAQAPRALNAQPKWHALIETHWRTER